MFPKIFRLFAIFLVSANNLFGYFNNTKCIESDSLKPSKPDYSYKDDRLEIDKYGNVIKDLDKGVLYVQYLNSSTSELYPYGNISMPTTNFYVDEIRFTDGAVMKYKYNHVPATQTKIQIQSKLIFRPVHIRLEHNNRVMVDLDRQGDFTIADGKDLYSVNFTGGRAIPDLRTTDSFFYEFTEPDPKKRPKVLVQETKEGITVNFNYDHLSPLFNYEDYFNQRRTVPKHDSLQKGYYFNGNIYKLKAMITRNMFGMQYKIENNAMRVNETYDYFPNRNAQKMPEGLHDFSQIDVFDKIEVFNAQSKGFIEVVGSFNGEYYSDTEMYILDGQNRKIWLGRDGNPGKMFLGKDETPKIDSNYLKIKILLDVNRNFRAVHNGSKTYSINEWNKKMEEKRTTPKFIEF
jgi:hypothetical protein